jgi:hypothetical protein
MRLGDRVYYEWLCEFVDEHGDIQEVIHANTYTDILRHTESDEFEVHVGLVRDTENSRSWAYIKDGGLPEFFRDAFDRKDAKVPKRFIVELARGNKS